MISQAVGLDSCEGNQEETVTDAEGQYRLRGLQVLYLIVYASKYLHNILF